MFAKTLRHLHLPRNLFTKVDLHKVLVELPLLESLDLSQNQLVEIGTLTVTFEHQKL